MFNESEVGKSPSLIVFEQITDRYTPLQAPALDLGVTELAESLGPQELDLDAVARSCTRTAARKSSFL